MVKKLKDLVIPIDQDLVYLINNDQVMNVIKLTKTICYISIAKAKEGESCSIIHMNSQQFKQTHLDAEEVRIYRDTTHANNVTISYKQIGVYYKQLKQVAQWVYNESIKIDEEVEK